MTYRNGVNIVALGCLLVSLLGCETTPEPQKVGVFAATNHGLLELTTYGKQIGENVYSLSSLSEIPKTSKVERFYVNMPGSTITEVKVFWLTTLDKNFDDRNQTPLDASIETGKGNVYRINCAGLSDKKGGYVLLKVPMPLGVADRAYVVQVTG